MGGRVIGPNRYQGHPKLFGVRLVLFVYCKFRFQSKGSWHFWRVCKGGECRSNGKARLVGANLMVKVSVLSDSCACLFGLEKGRRRFG